MALNAVWKTTKRHFSSLLFSPPYVHLAAVCSQVQNSTSCSFQSKKVKIFTTNNFWTRLKRIVVKIESRLMNNTQIFVCHTWHTFDSNVRSITTTTSGQFFLKLNATPSKMKSEGALFWKLICPLSTLTWLFFEDWGFESRGGINMHFKTAIIQCQERYLQNNSSLWI